MSNRYGAMGQIFIANGTGVITEVGRQIADAELNVTTEGTIIFTMANGTTGTVASGSAAVPDDLVTLVAGINSIAVTGTGTINLDITIGTAANTNTVNSWSATDGGAVGASIPTSADNVFFTANAFTAGSQILTVNAALSVLNLDFTGATQTPTLAGSETLAVYGNFLTIAPASLTWSYTGILSFIPVADGQTVRTNGITFLGHITFTKGTVTHGNTLLDAFNAGNKQINFGWNNLDTNGQTVTCALFTSALSGSGRTLTAGNSVFNCASWNISTGVTLTANTSTINISGTGAFAGGSPTGSYYDINLNGTSHAVSGNFTCHDLKIAGGKATISSTPTITGRLIRTGSGRIIRAGTAGIILRH